MSTKKQTPVSEDLSAEDRRLLAMAAKDIVQLHMASAVPNAGVAVQNFQMWCKGSPNRLGLDRQMAILNLFGYTPLGQIADNYTHAWRIAGRESAPMAEQMLVNENDIKGVVITPAYTKITPSSEEIGLVGVLVEWTGPYRMRTTVKQRKRRLILTAVAGTWLAEDFKNWVLKLFTSRAACASEVRVGGDVRISISAANAVWRWHASPRKSDGSRFAVTKRKSLLPLDQDLVGEQSTGEDALDVLQDMGPRFKELATKTAELRKMKIGPHDLALIRRANQVLIESNGKI